MSNIEIIGTKSDNLSTEKAADRSETEVRAELNDMYKDDYLEALSLILTKKFNSEKEEPLFSTPDGVRFDTLNDLLDHLLSGLSQDVVSVSSRSKLDVIKSILDNMSRLPSGQSMSIRNAVETGKMFCSVSAATFQLLMEKIQSRLNVRVEYVNPVGHAANVISFVDGDRTRSFYADPRNNILDEITDNVTLEERGNLRIYRSKSGGILSKKVLFGILPSIIESDQAMVYSDVGNYEEMVNFAHGDFGEDGQRMGPELAQKLRESAEEYLTRLGVLGDKQKEEEFTSKYGKMREIAGSEMDIFRSSEEFKKEEQKGLVERTSKEAWEVIPDGVKKALLGGDGLERYILDGDEGKLGLSNLAEASSPKIIVALRSIRESFGMRWVISNYTTEDDKLADLKPYINRARDVLGVKART